MGDLKARYSECEKAFMGKNVDEYCTFLHADVEMWAPHGPPVVGKEAVSATFHQMMPTLEVKEVQELKVEEYGDFGLVTCRTHIKGKNFKNMLMWKKDSSGWLIFRDIFISADPPPPEDA